MKAFHANRVYKIRPLQLFKFGRIATSNRIRDRFLQTGYKCKSFCNPELVEGQKIETISPTDNKSDFCICFSNKILTYIKLWQSIFMMFKALSIGVSVIAKLIFHQLWQSPSYWKLLATCRRRLLPAFAKTKWLNLCLPLP